MSELSERMRDFAGAAAVLSAAFVADSQTHDVTASYEEGALHWRDLSDAAKYSKLAAEVTGEAEDIEIDEQVAAEVAAEAEAVPHE